MGGISPVFKQFLAIICCNLLTFFFGSQIGWATINFLEFQSVNSTLPTGQLTLDESSLVISLVNVGGFIGNFAILPIGQLFGIKRTIHLFVLPSILSSILTIFAQNVYYLYAARVFAGIVGGSLVVGIPSFINDISNDNIRGALYSLYDPSYNLGVIIAFFLGNFLNCLDQLKVELLVLVIFAIVLFLFPESPEYLLKNHQEKRALKSRAFYKGNTVTPEHIEFIPKIQAEKVENGKLEEVDDESDSKLTIRDFFTPQARKAFFISFTMLLLSFSSGSLTILSYATDIFSKTGSSLSEKNSSLLVSITQIIGNLVLLNIIERFNRRTLYIWSSILTMASYFLFAAYCSLWINRPEFEWMPPFCFCMVIYWSCMGLLPIPYILTIEIFPKKIRQTCLSFSVSLLWIILFILGTIFPSFLQRFDLPICMMTLGVVSSLNVVFGYFFVPETRGKSYDEIMQLLK